MAPVRLTYFSDILCIWAYIAERRVEELLRKFGDELVIEAHFCSVFPDAWGKITDKWSKRGGFEGFNRHLMDVAENFPHIEVHDRIWLDARPRTSASAHLFIKAIEIIEADRQTDGAPPIAYIDRLSTRAAWTLRRAFFR